MSLSVNQARKILGKYSHNLSDPVIQDLLNQFYSLAEVISNNVSFNGSNKNTRVIDSNIGKGQNGHN